LVTGLGREGDHIALWGFTPLPLRYGWFMQLLKLYRYFCWGNTFSLGPLFKIGESKADVGRPATAFNVRRQR